jgi:hypothetical protein
MKAEKAWVGDDVCSLGKRVRDHTDCLFQIVDWLDYQLESKLTKDVGSRAGEHGQKHDY